MEEEIIFENAQELHQKRPRTVRIPDKEELDAIKPGDYVKVGALGERFWTEILSIHEGAIRARIDDKISTGELRYDMEISFSKENIFGIVTKELYAKALAARRQQQILQQCKRKKGL